MTGNISYLSEYEPYDGGYMSFGQGGGKITSKGIIKTSKLEFENVYFVKDLKYNLFSVSQIYDNKNSVLFTDSKCIVLEKVFKLKDDTNVLLMTPRQHNMYSIDLNNIVPNKNLTCLVAKAFADESMLWHRRLGHLNFKSMNKVLVNKSQHKTPYELFNSRTPAIGFLRPFGCHVVILNTLDHLGKFDAKGDKGYSIGYSMSSKAFRVFNKRTKKVEENMHWLFQEHLPLTFQWKLQSHCYFKNSPADQMETLILESVISCVSSPVPTACLDTAPKTLSGSRLISKEVLSQEETPSLDNALTLSNRFEDTTRVEADFSNMESSIPGSPTPTFRIHKDHPKSQIISPVDTPVQTRHKSKEMEEHNFIAIIHQKTTPDLLEFCLFSCFLSQEEPNKIFDALKDPSWVEAMQEELLQFKIQNVWILVDCPKGIRPIGTKWVLKNKKDEKGIVIRNKASLVAQGHTQDSRAYTGRSAFLYGTIDEEVYVMQPLGFQDPEFPDRVYKVEKAMGTIDQTLFIRKHRGDFLLLQVYVDDSIIRSSNPQLCREFKALMHEKFQMSAMGELNFFLGLQVLQKKDVIFLSQDKYVGDILKRFGYLDVRSMIGSLMYLTASRPDIMFVFYACARHQVTPKECHLYVVKRIFRYLKGHPTLGLWYPEESPFDLVAYSDSDYGGATQDRKSTTGGCQFLERRLISWQCKKQIIVAISITEVEYVAAASDCR
nr:hypothetical protein [Tanacetum cinerariifolium]